jgi:hypothetical protein
MQEIRIRDDPHALHSRIVVAVPTKKMDALAAVPEGAVGCCLVVLAGGRDGVGVWLREWAWVWGLEEEEGSGGGRGRWMGRGRVGGGRRPWWDCRVGLCWKVGLLPGDLVEGNEAGFIEGCIEGVVLVV